MGEMARLERAGVPTWVCEATQVAAGQRVLDLGSGTGLPSLELAKRVGPSGQVIATDVSPEMLAALAANARKANLANIECREMSAEKIEFPDDSFDVVTCAFVLMFRPDPAAVVREIRRVLKPGGRFAVVVWDEPAKNPFFTAAIEPVGRFIPLPIPDPKAPGTFGLAAAGKLADVLRAGGFSDSTVESLPFKVMFESVGQHWQIFSEMAPPLKAAAESLPEGDLTRLKKAIADGLRPHTEDGRVFLTATPLCAAGRID
jgi:SAM-dependent methyltransferase